jgi:hypothetical protein
MFENLVLNRKADSGCNIATIGFFNYFGEAKAGDNLSRFPVV